MTTRRGAALAATATLLVSLFVLPASATHFNGNPADGTFDPQLTITSAASLVNRPGDINVRFTQADHEDPVVFASIHAAGEWQFPFASIRPGETSGGAPATRCRDTIDGYRDGVYGNATFARAERIGTGRLVGRGNGFGRPAPPDVEWDGDIAFILWNGPTTTATLCLLLITDDPRIRSANFPGVNIEDVVEIVGQFDTPLITLPDGRLAWESVIDASDLVKNDIFQSLDASLLEAAVSFFGHTPGNWQAGGIDFAVAPAVSGTYIMEGIFTTCPETDPTGEWLNCLSNGGTITRQIPIVIGLPSPAITAPAAGALLNTSTVTVSGTSDQNATVRIRDGATAVGVATADGSGAWSMPISFADGSHTITAATFDAGGEGPPSASRSFSVDTVAPAAPVITTPAEGSFLNNGSVAVNGTAEPGSTVRVLEGATVRATTTASGGGSWSATIPFSDGGHTITATATDAAANVSAPSGPRSFTVDTAAPSAPIISTPASGAALNSSLVTVSGTGEPGATVKVFEGATQRASAVAAPDGSWTADVSFADGTHTITATATDAAQNVSPASAARTFSVDTVAPAVPSITSPSEGAFVNSGSVTVSGSAEPGSVVRIFEGVDQRAQRTADGLGSWSVAVPFADGTHTITATATDAAGNQSVPTGARTFTVDTVAPPVPSITDPAAGAFLSSSAVTVTGTAEPGSTVKVLEGAAVKGTTTAGGAGAYSVTIAFADGAHTIAVTATDAAGNASARSDSRTFTVDTIAPAAPVFTAPAQGSAVATSDVPLAGTAEAGSTVRIYEGAALAAETAADPTGAWSAVLTLADGLHTLTATATDAAGNISAVSAARTFTVDTIAPAAPAITSPADGATLTSGLVRLAGTAEPGATVRVLEGTTLKAQAIAGATGDWSATGSFASGAHTVAAVARDRAGNASPPSAEISFTIDTAAPGPPTITVPADGSAVRTASVTVSGLAEPLTTVKVFEGEMLRGSASATSSGDWSLAIAFADGEHTIRATATRSGNESPPSDATAFEVDTIVPVAPAITTPPSGATLGTTSVAVGGTAEPGSLVRVYEGAGIRGEGPADATGAWAATITAASGSHTITARSFDRAGNVSAASAPSTFTVDLAAPPAPDITAPLEGAFSASSDVTVRGIAEAASNVTVYEDGASIGSATADAQRFWSLGGSFADGPHHIVATATDRAGNTSAPSAERSFTVDATAPVPPSITTPVEEQVLSASSILVGGAAEPGADVTVREGSTLLGREAAGPTGAWSLTLSFADGRHTISATATDAAGHESAASARTFTVDTTPPAPPVFTLPAQNAVLTTTAVAIGGTAEAGALVDVADGGVPLAQTTATGSGQWSLTVSLAEGTHDLTATATDAAGNTSAPSAVRRVTVDTAATGRHPYPRLLAPAAFRVFTGTSSVPVQWQEATVGEQVAAYIVIVARPGEFGRTYSLRTVRGGPGDPCDAAGVCTTTLTFPLALPGGGSLAADDKYAIAVIAVFRHGHRSDGACDDGTAFGTRFDCDSALSDPPGYDRPPGASGFEFFVSPRAWPNAYQDPSNHDVLLVDPATGDFEMVGWRPGAVADVFRGTATLVALGVGTSLVSVSPTVTGLFDDTQATALAVRPPATLHLMNGQRL